MELKDYFLILDIGNSKLKAAIYSNNEEIEVFSIKTGSISKIFFNKILKKFKVKKCFIGSVVPNATIQVKNILKSFNLYIKEIKPKDFINVLNLNKINEKINKIGVDLLGFSYFLKNKWKKSIGFCFGTFSFSIFINNGALNGAIIFPHIKDGINSLFKNAALIDAFNLNNYDHSFIDFGKNTYESIISGANHFYIGSLVNFINYFYLKNKTVNYCITGGDKTRVIMLKKIISNKKIKINVIDNAVIKGYAKLILTF